MSERLRAYWPVLAVILGAIVLATLGRRRPLSPPGAPSRRPPDGGRALYLWVDLWGGRRSAWSPWGRSSAGPRKRCWCWPPAIPLDEADREALDAVPAAGGTLILAGPPAPCRGYLETLGDRDVQRGPWCAGRGRRTGG